MGNHSAIGECVREGGKEGHVPIDSCAWPGCIKTMDSWTASPERSSSQADRARPDRPVMTDEDVNHALINAARSRPARHSERLWHVVVASRRPRQ